MGLGKASFCLESRRRHRQQEIQGPGPGRELARREGCQEHGGKHTEMPTDFSESHSWTGVQLSRHTAEQVQRWTGEKLDRYTAGQVQKSELSYYLQASFSLARGICFGAVAEITNKILRDPPS